MISAVLAVVLALTVFAHTPAVKAAGTVLYEEGGIRISYVKTEKPYSWSDTIDVVLEVVNSSDRDIIVQTDDTSLNGRMIHASISETVNAGKTANAEMTFLESYLEQSGINGVGVLETKFVIIDEETWKDTLYTDPITLTLDPSIENDSFSGPVIYDQDGIRVEYLETVKNDYGSVDVMLHIINSTDEKFILQVEDTSINDRMITGLISEDVMPGKDSVADISFTKTAIEKAGVGEFQYMDTTLVIIPEDWKDILRTDEIHVDLTKTGVKEEKKADVSGIEMYRLYNPNSGEHFYTSSTEEKSVLVNAGWKYEGIGWTAPSDGDPVYRLYNANAGDHHYTMSEGEKEALVSYGWKYEGIGWYSDANQSVPLYRQYNPNANGRFP